MMCVTSRRGRLGCTASFRAARQEERQINHGGRISRTAPGHAACHSSLRASLPPARQRLVHQLPAQQRGNTAVRARAAPYKAPLSLCTCFSLGTTWNWLVVALMMATFSSCPNTRNGQAGNK